VLANNTHRDKNNTNNNISRVIPDNLAPVPIRSQYLHATARLKSSRGRINIQDSLSLHSYLANVRRNVQGVPDLTNQPLMVDP